MAHNNPCQYGTSLYKTPMDALIACCQDWVTGGGGQHPDDVSESLRTQGADGLVDEMLADDWDVPGQWDREDVVRAMGDAVEDYANDIIH